MKKVVLILVLVATAAVAAALLRRPEAPGDPIPEVRVTPRQTDSAVKATGVIKPMIGAEVRVGARVSGIVRRLHVRIGDVVGKGQLLAELDDRELAARRNQAKAALRLAEANRSYAEAELARVRALSAAQLVSKSALDLAEQACEVARQQANSAAANIEVAATELGYARIVAPIAGVVSAVSTQEGETVAASFAAPTFVTLLDLSRLEVWAYVDETDVGRIHAGQSARFTVDTYSGREIEGRVTSIHPQAEIRDNVVNYVAVLSFERPPGCVLRPEMTALVRIETSENERGAR
jgi:RND family efflux transporter MFP subunit